MTAIAGFVHSDGSVWVGGDSAGVAGFELTRRADPKVFRNGNFLFGFTSSFRMGQLLRYAFQPPAKADSVDVMAYMATTFIDAVRACLKSGGYASRVNETESAGEFLVGFHGRLFLIESDYQVSEACCDYAARGAGSQIACGALYATRDHVDPRERMIIALHAAEHHNAAVRGPFTILQLEALKSDFAAGGAVSHAAPYLVGE